MEQLEFFSGEPGLRKFIEFLFSSECDTTEIWCHFGGIYDFLFILDEVLCDDKIKVYDMIPRGSGLLQFTISLKGREITFRDSSAILPFGLDSITKNFGVEHKKLKMDRSKITNDTPLVREYLTHDVKGLYESIKKFREWGPIKDVGMKPTIASQSIAILRKYLPVEIPALNQGDDEFIRKGYFGGRTEIYKPLFEGSSKKLLHVYDINSLYPYCMREYDFPVHIKSRGCKFTLGETVGFVDCLVEIPDMYCPPLPSVQMVTSFYADDNGKLKKRESKKLIFPTGIIKGSWSSLELEYAASLGVKILKVYDCMSFHKVIPVFKDFVNTMYDIRQKAEKNSVDNTLAKLVLNSCYGRMGLNRSREKLDFEAFKSGENPCYEFSDGRGRAVRIAKSDYWAKNTFSHVGIAAWVTSAARIENHKNQSLLDFNVFMTDTDSFFTTKKLKTGGALGELKLEYDVQRACFLLPKTYLVEAPQDIFSYEKESGEKVRTNKKLAMKGFDKTVINGFTFKDFAMAVEGDCSRLKTHSKGKMARMKTAWNKGEVLTLLEDSTKQIRSSYDKRRIVRTRSGKYDTEPLHFKDGKIQNARSR